MEVIGSNIIPTIDLSSFFSDGEEEGKKKVTELIKQACCEHGLIQVVNHGIPIGLLNQSMDVCRAFFDLPFEEKQKWGAVSDSCLPFGYTRHRSDKNECLFMCPPGATVNILPSNPPKLKPVVEELFAKLSELCQLMDGILNDCLHLPPNLLKDYNNNRCLDNLMILRYFPATETEDNGAGAHQDPTVSTIIFQDNVGGLEILIDGEWIPVVPVEGALIFHISDIMQVLTNDEFKSPVHRVVRRKGKDRQSFVFCYNLSHEKWVEPFPQLTKEIGQTPKYRRFRYKDYFDQRVKDKLHPPANPEDKTDIVKFANAT